MNNQRETSSRVAVTPAARQAIMALRAARGPVMFVQSGGCCGGTATMCFTAGEFLTGDRDILLGEVEGCPVYIDHRLDEAWGHPRFLLDARPGSPEGFSLAAGDGLHFVTLVQAEGQATAAPE
jgi:uncharacterized protein